MCVKQSIEKLTLRLISNLLFGIRSEIEVEPDAVPETKDAADGETGAEREEEATSVQVDEMMATEAPDQETEPENPVGHLP